MKKQKQKRYKAVGWVLDYGSIIGEPRYLAKAFALQVIANLRLVNVKPARVYIEQGGK